MKVTSTVAYQAFTERNLTRRRLYWTMPWPIGIHGIPRRLLIDADEFGLHLNDANRKYVTDGKGDGSAFIVMSFLRRWVNFYTQGVPNYWLS